MVQVCFGRDGTTVKEHLIKRRPSITTSSHCGSFDRIKSGSNSTLGDTQRQLLQTPRTSLASNILYPENDGDNDEDDFFEDTLPSTSSTSQKAGKQSWLNVRAAMAYYNSLRKIKRLPNKKKTLYTIYSYTLILDSDVFLSTLLQLRL